MTLSNFCAYHFRYYLVSFACFLLLSFFRWRKKRFVWLFASCTSKRAKHTQCCFFGSHKCKWDKICKFFVCFAFTTHWFWRSYIRCCFLYWVFVVELLIPCRWLSCLLCVSASFHCFCCFFMMIWLLFYGHITFIFVYGGPFGISACGKGTWNWYISTVLVQNEKKRKNHRTKRQ